VAAAWRIAAHVRSWPTDARSATLLLYRLKTGGIFMGMTVWVHVLNGRKIEGNQNDCSWMHRLADPLDRCCERHEVAMLSSFFDYTDLEANMEESDEEEPPADPETGLPYGIDDMNWFEATSGLHTLRKLAEVLEGGERCPGLPAERRHELLEELQDCIRQLQPAAKKRQKFHMAVIM
jgi:hypothetical protein